MTSGSLALAVVFAVLLLPAVVKPGGTVLAAGGILLSDWARRTRWLAVAIIVLSIVAMVIARNVRFDGDITRLDGAGASVAQAEADFQKMWKVSGGELAMLAVNGRTREEAAQRSDEVYALVSATLGDGKLVSLSQFWPSEQTRHTNLERWQAFWNPQRVAELRRDLAIAGERFGFAPDAFDPFFQSLAVRDLWRYFPKRWLASSSSSGCRPAARGTS